MAQNPIVTITMENGDVIKAELYPEIAPTSVNNFISLIQKKFYDALTETEWEIPATALKENFLRMDLKTI